MSNTAFVSAQTLERSIAAIQQLTRSARARIAYQVSMFPTAEEESAFHSVTDDVQCESLLEALKAYDARSPESEGEQHMSAPFVPSMPEVIPPPAPSAHAPKPPAFQTQYNAPTSHVGLPSMIIPTSNIAPAPQQQQHPQAQPFQPPQAPQFQPPTMSIPGQGAPMAANPFQNPQAGPPAGMMRLPGGAAPMGLPPSMGMPQGGLPALPKPAGAWPPPGMGGAPGMPQAQPVQATGPDAGHVQELTQNIEKVLEAFRTFSATASNSQTNTYNLLASIQADLQLSLKLNIFTLMMLTQQSDPASLATTYGPYIQGVEKGTIDAFRAVVPFQAENPNEAQGKG